MDTFASNDVGIRRRRGHLEGQAVGPLERVAVSDEESSWSLVFQNSYGCSGEDTLKNSNHNRLVICLRTADCICFDILKVYYAEFVGCGL